MAQRDYPNRFRWRVIAAITAVVFSVIVVLLIVRFRSNSPVTYSDTIENFKYGSTGGEVGSGIPYSLWMAMPEIFPEYLPGKGYASLGFLYEKGKDLPIGVSKRRVQGIDRVFFNCAICHVGSVRDSAGATPRLIAGMPSNTVDLRGYYEFLFNAVLSEKFTPGNFLSEIKLQGTHEDFINRAILRFYAITTMQNQIVGKRARLQFIMSEPEFGPGRIDTFSPAKALLNFRMTNAPAAEAIGTTDFPSIWNQRQRDGMQLHWDGNNTKLQERNRSAAFGTGAYPPTIDRKEIVKVENWILDAKPPKFFYGVDAGLAAQGSKVYAGLCADCHGPDGQNFHPGQGKLGTVTPIDSIGTDRARLDSYTFDLAVNQNLLYAGYGDERFSHFRKTNGYANMPLDGVWLRAPYLHNGSVPTMRDLLKPAAQRTKSFYRGDDVYDQTNMGFESNVPERDGHKFFLLDTTVKGNGNQGHEGQAYGTELSEADKNALIEFLKTF